MRIFNICFIFFFALMLALPLVFVDLSSDRVSILENRMLAGRPKIADIKDHPGTFIRQFDEWFKDSTGFREQFIDIYKKTDNVFKYGIFLDGTTIVLIGKQGHHFHTHHLPIYQGKRWLGDVHSYELSVKFNDINQYLYKKNIYFVVMICADKESIYPEYYPDFVIRGPEPTSLDIVVKYLSEHTSVDLFCIKERFFREKENYLLYPKIGNVGELTHYNETGAFIAYQELMQHINKYFPDLEPFSLEDVNIQYRTNGSSSVILKHEKKYEQIEARFFDDAIEFENRNAGFPTLEFENRDAGLPTLLLFNDSYAAFFPNYLPQHFGKTIIRHWNTLNSFYEYIDLYKPDIVVFETAERSIPYFANCVFGILDLP